MSEEQEEIVVGDDVFDDIGAELDFETDTSVETLALTLRALSQTSLSTQTMTFAYLNITPCGALESLKETVSLEDIADAAESKAKSMATSLLDRLKSFIDTSTKTMTGKVTHLKELVHSKALQLKETIKAHPYATAALVVTALVSVGSIIKLSQMGLTPAVLANSAKRLEFIKKVKTSLSALKIPGVKVDISQSANSLKTVFSTVAVPVKEGTTQALGYTASACGTLAKGLQTGLSSIFSGLTNFGASLFSGFKWIIGQIGKGAAKALTSVDTLYGRAAKKAYALKQSKSKLSRIAGAVAIFVLIKSLTQLLTSLTKCILKSTTEIIASAVKGFTGKDLIAAKTA